MEQNLFFIFKTLHFIGLVSWFAGLFYLPRLFIYHTEAITEKGTEEREILHKQFVIMSRKLYKIIMNPAMMLTFFAGFSMIGTQEMIHKGGYFVQQPWLWLKLILLLGLLAYHIYCKKILKALETEQVLLNSMQLRLFNEIATLFLLAIVLLAVFKHVLNFLYAGLTLLGFGFLLFLVVKWYKKYRMKHESKEL